MSPSSQTRPVAANDLRPDWKSLEYALSHDIEAPLRGIKGLARILSQKHAARLEGEAGDLLQLINAEAERASRLLGAVLDWSRYGQQPLALSWQNPTDIAQEAFAAIVSVSPAREIEFNLQPLPRVWCDRSSLRRLFVELFSNALKFTGKRPIAVISVSGLEADLETSFTVRDNGAGFDMAHTGQLFGLFRRLHRNQEFAGDGAGLAIARKIVELHRGRIWAEAQTDQGAAFHFALPKPDSGSSTSPVPPAAD